MENKIWGSTPNQIAKKITESYYFCNHYATASVLAEDNSIDINNTSIGFITHGEKFLILQ